jgi:hypothetical protein
MSLPAEIDTLRRRMEQLAGEADTDLIARYALRYPPPERRSLYLNLRMIVGRVLRRLGLRRARPLEPWLPELKHVEQVEGAKPFLIWALDTDRETLRKACEGFTKLQNSSPGYIPVLVTNVADFSFFSRLGWLVEYVPALSTPAGGYAERKRQYLAWRYRDVPALPVSAGLTEGVLIEDLLID